MHLGEQVRCSGKKKRSFYFSCTFHCSYTLLGKDKLKLLVLKAEVEADKLKLSVQKNRTMTIFAIPINNKGVSTRMNRSKIFKDEG